MNQLQTPGTQPANDSGTSPHYERLVVPRLSPERRLAFEDISPTALWIAANLTGAQQRYWGDNQGGWPVMMGLTQSWEDRKSAVLSSSESYQERALITRFWCDDWDEADQIWRDTYQSLLASRQFEDGRGDWMSFSDDDAGLALITTEIRKHAAARKIEVWTDKEMLRRFDYLIAIARKVGE
ncbi:hypothetical protein DLM45_10865 [Hyphomicrobium methylovorum]|uniref:hypothetical protein n=1 Tax=Hyphomicrobium methylovorum TaxID=84 RepID=UPI0015E7AB01|nr:hypothetical protein [Hyphomicrobium methylovorum]MBA2126713.1 hypothetical protein [Hyphomicrobium methylovorum]